MQAFDEFEIENEAGTREVDIIIASIKHDLDLSPEVQAILQRAKQFQQQQIAEKFL